MLSEKKKQSLKYRKARLSLTRSEQHKAARAIARHARGFLPIYNCQRLLSYSPFGGEIDPSVLASSLGALEYLPKITNYRMRRMRFFSARQGLTINSLGITEPSEQSPSITGRELDVVLMPLVGFDRNGNRIGMGAGFYDRAFEFRNTGTSSKRPLLIGLAHHFQEIESIDADTWDVPLDAIITDRELIIPTHS